MKKRSATTIAIWVIGGCFLVTACSSTSPDLVKLRAELNQKDARIEELVTSNEKSTAEVETLAQSNFEKDQLISEYKMKLESQPPAAQAISPTMLRDEVASLFPPDAEPGECFARVFIPPTYRTQTEDVLVTEASERIEIIPAKYGWREEQVLVKEASERIEVVPAEYKWVEESVMVKPASTKIVEIPAKYGWNEEKILVKQAHTVWKKGRGLIEKVDDTTGEIMCRVTVPASYRTVKRKVQISPPSTSEVEIPAEYETIKKQVMAKPPTRRVVPIPAEYKTMKVRTVVEPAKQNRIPIPASYQTITKTIQVSEGEMAWRRILCETNVDNDMVRQIQMALDDAGISPGPIDGIIGPKTNHAINQFQQKKNLAVGGLTYETIKQLGIEF